MSAAGASLDQVHLAISALDEGKFSQWFDAQPEDSKQLSSIIDQVAIQCLRDHCLHRLDQLANGLTAHQLCSRVVWICQLVSSRPEQGWIDCFFDKKASLPKASLVKCEAYFHSIARMARGIYTGRIGPPETMIEKMRVVQERLGPEFSHSHVFNQMDKDLRFQLQGMNKLPPYTPPNVEGSSSECKEEFNGITFI